MKKPIFSGLVALSVICAPAREIKPFQLSLASNIALHPNTTIIHGLALNLQGENSQQALNLGFMNGSTGKSGGFSVAFTANVAESYSGVMWSMVNVSTVKFIGWQGGLVNFSQGGMVGVQTGLINAADECHGLQLGWFNFCENLHGVQIGFLNISQNNPWFEQLPRKFTRGFPLLNWSF
jgi:hypothetical protein